MNTAAEKCTCRACPLHTPRVNLNAAACAPAFGGTVVIVNGQGWQPAPVLPPPAAACAGNPTAGWFGNY